MKNQSFVWHPYTQMKDWPSFPKIVRGDGMWLVDSHENRLLDGVASMWCNVWGHSKKEMISAIHAQSKKISHSSLFNLTNDQAEKLAGRLIGILPGMHRVFFSDDGSTAMEISLKIATQYWQNMGEKKTVFATLENGYHGDTYGAMSAGYVPGFFSPFKSQLFKTIRIPFVNDYRIPPNKTKKDYLNSVLEKIEKVLATNDRIAAFVMESGAQLAGGVNIYQDGFQAEISRICRKHGTLFVLDEIATGFGRLGSLVEYVAQKSIPDIVSHGKMLTGGYMTLATTSVSKKIYNSFLGQYLEMKHFFHGHTFTGNPLACAVANKNLDLYEKTRLMSRVQKTSRTLAKRLQEFDGIDIVGDVRSKGLLAAIELVKDAKKTPLVFRKSTNKVVFDEAKKHGIYLRALGNIVMLVPPLAISESELNFLIDGTLKTLKNISKSTKRF